MKETDLEKYISAYDYQINQSTKELTRITELIEINEINLKKQKKEKEQIENDIKVLTTNKSNLLTIKR
jgi:lipid II:glycine glycyltransferase (peptidoglycan interpeptide bridge formation enzyme)